MKRSHAAAAASLLVVLPLWACAENAPAYRFEEADRELPTEITVEGHVLKLHGTAVLRMGLVFKIYAASLYLPAGVRAESVLDDIPKRLEVYYLHETPRERMIETANKTLARNLEASRLERLKPPVDTWHAAYRDGPKGGVAALTYVPGSGTQYALNGDVLVTVPGPGFAAAYFGVWLGEHPGSKSVKKQLLTPLPGGQRAQ